MITQNAFIYFPSKWWKEAGASTSKQVEAKQKIEDTLSHLDDDLKEAYKIQLQDLLNRDHEVEKKAVTQLTNELAKYKARYKIDQDKATKQIIDELEELLSKPLQTAKLTFSKPTAKAKAKQQQQTDDPYDDLVDFPKGFDGDRKEAMKYRSFEHEGRIWVIEKNYCKAVSNFTMDIKFHIPNGRDVSYQLITLKSIHGVTKTELLNTDDLITVNAFKKILRRIGGAFAFNGGEATLDKVMERLQMKQKNAKYINVLGWQPKSELWAWSNEVTSNTGKVLKLDKYGMFTHNKETWMIPANSVMFADFEEEFEDQRRFSTQKSDVKLKDWSKLHMEVYGKRNGAIGQAYMMMALFRDHIFGLNKIRATPILMGYGARGSGKGVYVDSLMRLFGEPQPEISLQSSNTTKGFLRKFAQFRNAVVWLDEYKNNLAPHIQETIKNLYDGVSYTRAKRTNDFQSDTLPINSSCILSGEEMPTGNSALFSRTILLTFEPGKNRTEEERKRFHDLKKMESKGITNITLEILKHRDVVVNNFERVFIEKQDDFYKALKPFNMDDRFIMCVSILSAVFSCLSEYIDTAFTSVELDQQLYENLVNQFEIFNSNDDLGRFWLLIENLLMQGVIRHGQEYEIQNGQIKIKIQDVHPLYQKESRIRGEHIILPKATLENYLASDPSIYLGKGRSRIGGVKNPVNHFTFDYTALKERYDIDLEPNSYELPSPVDQIKGPNLPFND